MTTDIDQLATDIIERIDTDVMPVHPPERARIHRLLTVELRPLVSRLKEAEAEARKWERAYARAMRRIEVAGGRA